MRNQRWLWGSRAVAVLVLAGLLIYLCVVGLDKSDKIATVLGALAAVAAFAAPYLLPISSRPDSRSRSAQVVSRTVVGGNLTQVRDARTVRVHDTPSAHPLPPLTSAADSEPVPEMNGGQYVNGVWVGGHLTQKSGSDGDLTIG